MMYMYFLKLLINAHWIKAAVTDRRTCKYVQSTCKNVGKIWGSARSEYHLRTDLGARRHDLALLMHEELSLSSCHGFTPVRMTRMLSTYLYTELM